MPSTEPRTNVRLTRRRLKPQVHLCKFAGVTGKLLLRVSNFHSPCNGLPVGYLWSTQLNLTTELALCIIYESIEITLTWSSQDDSAGARVGDHVKRAALGYQSHQHNAERILIIRTRRSKGYL